jgi:hypothetical protein
MQKQFSTVLSKSNQKRLKMQAAKSQNKLLKHLKKGKKQVYKRELMGIEGNEPI